MRGKAGEGVFVDGPQDVNNFSIHAREQDGRRAGQCVMRSDKTEYAMGAGGMPGGGIVRPIGRALAVMQTEFESQLAAARLRRQVKSAEYDQQALRGDGIGDQDADQRSQQTLWFHAEF
jgi:hypothetical protein